MLKEVGLILSMYDDICCRTGKGEGVSISVLSCEPDDTTTEVSVIRALGTEKTSEPSEMTDSSAVEPTETDTKFDHRESESTEKSSEPVKILCLFFLSVVRLCMCVCG